MDLRRRTLVPERLLLPPAPRDAELAARWRSLPFERRRALALVAVRGGTPAVADPQDRELVRALARARVATAWRLQVAAVVLGWLVLMTVWGFGRSTFPADEDRWRLGGLVVGAAVWVTAATLARRRVRRAARAT